MDRELAPLTAEQAQAAEGNAGTAKLDRWLGEGGARGGSGVGDD
jgi:hypothetical protein